MLERLRKQSISKSFIESILSEFETIRRLAVQREISDRREGFGTATRDALPVEDLTQREREVLTQLAEGLSNKEIGAKLFLSTLTVKKHLSNIYQKLGARKRLEAVKKARELGILPHN